MKSLVILVSVIFLTTFAFAAPAKKVTNRQLPDGGGSSKLVDPEKKRAVESVFKDGVLKYKIVYALDERLQPVSGIYYNTEGRVFQKSVYKLDSADRIVREIVYTPQNKLHCTKDFVYGYKAGKETIIRIDIYDSTGTPVSYSVKNPKRR